MTSSSSFKDFTSGTSKVFNRAVQKTEEAFNTAEKTPLDASLVDLIKQHELRKHWANQLLSLTRSMINPNPAVRIEDTFLKAFDRTKQRNTAGEQLGEFMKFVSNETGPSTPCGRTFNKCGGAQSAIGASEQDMMKEIEGTYCAWLQNYLETIVKKAEDERKHMEDARLDLDREKNKIRRTKPNDPKLGTYQQELSEKQAVFDNQSKATREAVDTSVREFNNHQQVLDKLLKSQLNYFEKCVSAIQNAMS